MKAVLEGLLFVVGEDGLSLDQIEKVLDIDEETAKELVRSLKNDYESPERGLRIDFLGNKIKLTTKREHKDYYAKLIENPETNTLSNAALEVLAIIAYNEPITRVDVDKIRGVSSSSMIRKLTSKGLIKEEGRSTLPGRPILYGVTTEFLDFFGLSKIEDLPNMDDFIAKAKEETDDEVDLYHSKYREDEEKIDTKEENGKIIEEEK